MPRKTFIDTNIFIYAADSRDSRKQKLARKWISELARQGDAVVSTQVIVEFIAAAVSKLKLSLRSAKRLSRHFAGFEVVKLDEELIGRGIDTAIIDDLSFWDGMILAAAAQANCAVLLTEDLNPGQTINGVTIVAPFVR